MLKTYGGWTQLVVKVSVGVS
ncbi:hypothetical protein OYC64_000463 [Pagothenia borchgrevinki]|uniref:Uncharacterized protein n=1 Tax=Pagothenia borchgrevinki TaxID=8213 RepID=A0ABD2HCQ0_PAGBO